MSLHFLVVLLHQRSAKVRKAVVFDDVLLKSDHFADPVVFPFSFNTVDLVEVEPHFERQRVVFVGLKTESIVSKQVPVVPATVAMINLPVFLESILVLGAEGEVGVGIAVLVPREVLFFGLLILRRIVLLLHLLPLLVVLVIQDLHMLLPLVHVLLLHNQNVDQVLRPLALDRPPDNHSFVRWPVVSIFVCRVGV